MEINEFISSFADQFDDTDSSEIMAETKFRELKEWSSMTGLAILNMINTNYSVRLNFSEFKSVNTVQELFDLVSIYFDKE